MISYDFTASYMYCTPKVRHKTFGVFFMKYSYEQRLIIVSRVVGSNPATPTKG